MGIGYREVAAHLREAIQSGTFAPGSTLPNQSDLARSHAVSLGTIRKAVGLLEAEGLVTPVRRRGTVVRPRPPMRRLGPERYAKSKWKFANVVAFAADRAASGRSWKPSDQTQTVDQVAADADVAGAFGVPLGTLVYRRARLIKDSGIPTHTLTSYYLPADVENSPIIDPTPGPAGPGGGFAVLTMLGLEPHHITETFHARMPTPAESQTLQLPAGEPVMILERRTYTSDNKIIEFAQGVHAASHFAWTYTFDIPD